MAQWTNATVTKVHWWNDKLFSLYVKADIEPFKAGQYAKLALEIDGKRTARAYSFVNAPNSDELEFLLIEVNDGALSCALANLKAQDTVQITTQSHGFFTLDELPTTSQLWMLSTGTAVGPFLSMLQTPTPYEQFEHLVLVHCVRNTNDLCYTDLISQLQQKHPNLKYVPVITREKDGNALNERIPSLLQTGALSRFTGITPSVEQSHFMICGNPDMVKDTTNTLLEQGYERHRRRTPGHITVEQYW